MNHGTTGDEHPVFVTRDGRARRAPRWFGRAVAGTFALWIGAVVVGGTGAGALPPLPSVAAVHPTQPPAHGTTVKYKAAVLRVRHSRV